MRWVFKGVVLCLALCSMGSPKTRAKEAWPGKTWPRSTPAESGLDGKKLDQARAYALSGGGSGMIVHRGRLIMAWGDLQQRYDLKSTTKSFGALALGLALMDGKARLDDPASRHHPAFGIPPEENRKTGWLDDVTLRHLATHTAGFEKPGGYVPLTFRPGTRWKYSDSGPNWLAECLTLAYRRDLRELLFERVFAPLGITRDDLAWRENAYRPREIGGIRAAAGKRADPRDPNAYRPQEIEGIPRREFGAGIHANVDALARIGLLCLREGRWNNRRLLPRDFARTMGRTDLKVKGLPVADAKEFGTASDHYGLLWWNNNDGQIEGVPRDAYWSWGLYDSLIVVIPSLDLTVARAGQSWARKDGSDHYDVLKPFLQPLAAVTEGKNEPSRAALGPANPAPYPPSRVFSTLKWAPAKRIIRKARGSDNWPLAWGDDDALYTAYGDGHGFEPGVPEKLSLGFAHVTGPPDAFRGENLRSPTLERKGDGAAGKKASGLLMVDGTLYLWARNAGNAQLAWSEDRGATWTWSDWRFNESFGCPTFLQFGKNYAGARDGYVYFYSFDSDSAYVPADRMVMARVPKGRIRDRAAYEFYAGGGERPQWSRYLKRRAAVFENPGRCYRSGISYHAPSKGYLWVQILPGEDTRFKGGFGVYDAPEPWGPWTTVYHTEEWDVGPGETASFPPKWMGEDGKILHLVFSGDDSFAVRRAELTLKEE